MSHVSPTAGLVDAEIDEQASTVEIVPDVHGREQGRRAGIRGVGRECRPDRFRHDHDIRVGDRPNRAGEILGRLFGIGVEDPREVVDRLVRDPARHIAHPRCNHDRSEGHPDDRTQQDDRGRESPERA